MRFQTIPLRRSAAVRQVPSRSFEMSPLDRDATARAAPKPWLASGSVVHCAPCLVHSMEPCTSDQSEVLKKIWPWKWGWLMVSHSKCFCSTTHEIKHQPGDLLNANVMKMSGRYKDIASSSDRWWSRVPQCDKWPFSGWLSTQRLPEERLPMQSAQGIAESFGALGAGCARYLGWMMPVMVPCWNRGERPYRVGLTGAPVQGLPGTESVHHPAAPSWVLRDTTASQMMLQCCNQKALVKSCQLSSNFHQFPQCFKTISEISNVRWWDTSRMSRKCHMWTPATRPSCVVPLPIFSSHNQVMWRCCCTWAIRVAIHAFPIWAAAFSHGKAECWCSAAPSPRKGADNRSTCGCWVLNGAFGSAW